MVSTGADDEDGEDEELAALGDVRDEDPGAEEAPDFDGTWEFVVVVDGECPGAFWDGAGAGDEDGGSDEDDDAEEDEDALDDDDEDEDDEAD